MAAAQKYTEDQILDAAALQMTEAGLDGCSVAAVARMLGAPSGSIYHRFESKQHLLGAVWIRTTQRYQAALRPAFAASTPEQAATEAVNATFDWLDTDQNAALLTMRFRSEELASTPWPDEVGEQLAHLAAELASQVNECASRLGSNPLDVVMAVIDIPSAAARRAVLFDNDVITNAAKARATVASRALLV